jgi:hypothetical protein
MPARRDRSDDVSGVAHPEGIEDVLADVVVERLAADMLDHLTDPVRADAVFPALARVAGQRNREASFLALVDRGDAGVAMVAEDVGVPDVIREPRRVRQQMAERDRTVW